MCEIAEKVNEINHTLEKQNEIIRQILDIMPRPAGKLTRVLETTVLVAGVFSFVTIADIIVKWIIGG
jgi:DNA-directed RNA polymerase subunit F